KDLLRSEVLDAQFEGLKQALQGGDPEQLARVKDMMAALNAMLDADARGEHTQADFDAFMDSFGEFFPDSPRTLEELVDSLARRAVGRQAVDDLAELRRIESELERQGYLNRKSGRLELTAKAVRRLGESALRKVFAQLHTGPRGDHPQSDAGQAGDLTGSSRQ